MQSPVRLAFVVVLACALSACDLFKGDDHSATQETPPPEHPVAGAAFGCQYANNSTDQAVIQRRYTLFESGHVRPLALSPDGQRLYVVNTPNNCLEVYATDATLTPLASIPVGLEPVAVAAPTNDEVWVVNQLSDSVSVVDVSGVPHVKATLLVGDEPRDIVFAGANRQRAFISAAYRGQNHPTFDSSDLRENGHGRADVWVFDRAALGAGIGGTPVTIVNLFSDTPRALAVSNDGTTVYAAAFMSGNRTTVIEEDEFDTTPINIVLGYYRNEAGGDLDFDQLEAITGYSRGTFGMSDEMLIATGISIGVLARVDGNLVATYRNTEDFRLNDQGQAVNLVTNEVQTARQFDGVALVAKSDLPPYVPPRTKPAPNLNSDGIRAPDTGLIVKFDGNTWRDETGADWSDKINFTLPDHDVFTIDAMADTPQQQASIPQVGTTLFNMAVNPVSGKIYVSNLETHNEVRFEGAGLDATTVRGNIAQSRVSVIDAGVVSARNLNKHLTHGEAQGDAIAADDKAKTLSQPLQMALTADGTTLYVAAMGSNKIGIFNTQALEQDTFAPDAATHIALPAAGPTGVVLNGNGSRLFVTTRIDNSVRVIDTANKQVLATRAMFSPEPQSVIEGRRFLYDADLSSANGESACSSCHLFGDLDALSWDLGNPEETMLAQPINEESPGFTPLSSQLHPLKGPMATQTLRGIKDHGPMHWRGDRTGNSPSVVDGIAESREAAAFKAFNPAFVTLLGREASLDDAQMQKFTDFSLQLMPPPNPIRALDNSLTDAQERGREIYMNDSTTPVGTCNSCHEVDAQKKRFGSDKTLTGEGGRVSQDFKVPQLRNAYTKVGRFDDNGEQIRGYGFLHDGSEPTLLRFLHSSVFSFPSDTNRDLVSDFVFAMDSNLAPIVGQQLTVTASNIESVRPRLQLLIERAQAQECDLVASAVINGKLTQGYAQSATRFVVAGGTEISKDQLLDALPVTFTCYPPGNAQRLF
jgi:YVTN family beta-propeller protein